MASVAWRRLFMVPVIIGTYFWLLHLYEAFVNTDLEYPAAPAGALTLQSFAQLWGRRITCVLHVVLELLADLLGNPVSAAFVAEYGFLVLHGGVAVTLLYAKRRHAGAYAVLAALSGSALSLALCNYAIPITPLEVVAQNNRQDVLKRRPRRKVTRTGTVVGGDKPDKPCLLPTPGHAAYSLLAWASLAAWLTPAGVRAGLVAGLLLPVGMVAVLVYEVKGEAVVCPTRSRYLLWAWVAAGALVSAFTRFGEDGLVRLVLSETPLNGRGGAWQDNVAGLFHATDETPLRPAYIAFAAQVCALAAVTYIFSLFDGDSQMTMSGRVTLAPVFLACPTVAIPLMYATRYYDDTPYSAAAAEAERGAKEKKQ